MDNTKKVSMIEIRTLVNTLGLRLIDNDNEGARAAIDDLNYALYELNTLLLNEEE